MHWPCGASPRSTGWSRCCRAMRRWNPAGAPGAPTCSASARMCPGSGKSGSPRAVSCRTTTRAPPAPSRCWAAKVRDELFRQRQPPGPTHAHRRRALPGDRRDGVQGPDAGLRSGRCRLHSRRPGPGHVQPRKPDGDRSALRHRRGGRPGRGASEKTAPRPPRLQKTSPSPPRSRCWMSWARC